MVVVTMITTMGTRNNNNSNNNRTSHPPRHLWQVTFRNSGKSSVVITLYQTKMFGPPSAKFASSYQSKPTHPSLSSSLQVSAIPTVSSPSFSGTGVGRSSLRRCGF